MRAEALACFALSANQQQDFSSSVYIGRLECNDYRGRNLKVAFLTLIAVASSSAFSRCQAKRKSQNPKGLLGISL